MEKTFKKSTSKALALGCALLVASTSAYGLIQTNDMEVSAETDFNLAKALQYSMYFYDANMCGTEVGENSALTWRDDCHTDDAKVSTSYGTLDLSGGYHDAGDHVKFGLPQAYSASILGWGYYEFKDAYTSTGQDGHLKTISTYFADYFKKCTVLDSSGNVTSFCYQVGDGDQDHAEWCAPEDQKGSRPVYFATSSNPATDIVSNTVGALAFHYKNFGDKESLDYAKALYNFAKKNSKQVASEGIGSFYQSDSYIDDLMWAAASLYVATGDTSYVSDANTFLNDCGDAYKFCSDWPLCWGNMWPAVNLIFGQLSSGISNAQHPDWGSLNPQMMEQVAKTLDGFQSKTTLDNTYVCFDNWGSARYNTAMQLVGLVYDKYNKTSKYTSWAEKQMNYLMGSNPKKLCYMTGFSDNSVTNPHHRAASGLSTFPTENATITMGHTLIGALVGGPMQDGSYSDQISLYKYTEVALDYNAGFVGALAGLYSNKSSGSIDSSIEGVKGSSSDTTTTTTTTTSTTEDTSDTSNTSESTTSVSDSDTSNSDNTTVTTAPTQPSESEVTTIVDEKVSSGGTINIPLNSIMNSGDKVTSISVSFESASGTDKIGNISGDINIDGVNGKVTGNINETFNSSTGTINISIPSDATLDANGNLTMNLWWIESGSVTVTDVKATISKDGDNTTVTTVPTDNTTTTKEELTTVTTVPTDYTTTSVTTTSVVDKDAELSKDSDGNTVIKVGDATSVTIDLQSKSNAQANGAIGYWDNDKEEWIELPWEASFDSNGKATIKVSNIPEKIQEVQFQKYWAQTFDQDGNGTDVDVTVDKAHVSTILTETTVTTVSTPTPTTASSTTTTKVTTGTSNSSTSTTKSTTATTKATTTTSATSNTNGTTVTTTTSQQPSSDVLLGDANVDGKVTTADLLILKKHLLGTSELSAQGKLNADTNKDGKVSTADLLVLKKYLLGTISNF